MWVLILRGSGALDDPAKRRRFLREFFATGVIPESEDEPASKPGGRRASRPAPGGHPSKVALEGLKGMGARIAARKPDSV